MRALRSNPKWCYLCGLPIPVHIAASWHPLFGTIDHVIPLSKRGRDTLSNRAPSHLVCNFLKSNGDFSADLAEECRRGVIPLLERVGVVVTRRMRRAARERSLRNWPATPAPGRAFPPGSAIQRWENEGGR